MDPLWIIHSSRDGGWTWKLEQPYRLFKDRTRAHERVLEMNRTFSYWKFKVVEYKPVEGGN